MRACVYCGSRVGARDAYTTAARRLGEAIGHQGGELIYGGGHVGLMGHVADAALAAGARVTGVIPKTLLAREVEHRGLSELIVVSTMHERKREMAERADLFIALPGGLGTLEELYEMWTWRQLGYHTKPMGLVNTDGYYDPLVAMNERAMTEGFVSDEQLKLVLVDDDPARLLKRLAALL
jgi:uncharacterized protein (TIGR00730 family)